MQNSTFAPVALFTYNRPDHTAKAIASLQANAEFGSSDIYIFSDAPRGESDRDNVEKTRDLIRSLDLPNLTFIERETNFGLAKSIITGTTELCGKYGRVIVLEDDLIVSPYFLEYMNAALDRYKDDERVMSVSGYMYPVQVKSADDALFLSSISSWGWATWQRAWEHFDATAAGFTSLAEDKERQHAFDLNGTYPYFEMLERQLTGKIDSWGIRWYLSVFLRGGISLYPVRSLVYNGGGDGSGVHCGTRPQIEVEEYFRIPFRVKKFPAREAIEVHHAARKRVEAYLAGDRQLGRRIIRRLLRLVRTERV